MAIPKPVVGRGSTGNRAARGPLPTALGDAENDYPFLDLCGMPVALANALPRLKDDAALVTEQPRGAGVAELIDRMLAEDPAEVDATNRRQMVTLAARLEGDSGPAIDVPPARSNVLLVGASGSGKSTLVTRLLERLFTRSFQCCIIDPEGDYAEMGGCVTVGSADHAPRPMRWSICCARAARRVSRSTCWGLS